MSTLTHSGAERPLKHRVRLGALLVAVLALLLLTSAVYLLAPPRRTDDIAVPPRDANPERVVKAYVDALNAHDCATALALVTTADAKTSAKSWCEDVASLTHVNIANHFIEESKWSGHSESQQVANVPVTFDLNWRAFHSDGSMPEGATTWGYLLVRNSTGSPWRIFSDGVG